MDQSTQMLDGFRAAGHAVDRRFFAFRCDSQPVNLAMVRAGVGIGAGVGQMTSTVFDHLASRATTSGQVAEHAAETYGDVADDAAQAEQDAQGMIDRARQHLDSILTARRDAEAAILRG